MKSGIFSAFLLTLLISAPRAQSKWPADSILGKHPYIKIIDKKLFYDYIHKKGSKVNYIMIITNHCGGTEGWLQFATSLRQLYDKKSLNIMIISPEPPAGIGGFGNITAILRKTIPDVYWINSDAYKDDPDDSREKGMSFRDDLCDDCRQDIIRTPYRMLADSSGNIINHTQGLGKEEVEAIINNALTGQ